MKFKPTMKAIRPKQWIKNLLLLAAPFAAGNLETSSHLKECALAVTAFCFVSSAQYLINDIKDIENDRQNPNKRMRPIASGELSIQVGLIMAAFAFLTGITIACVISWNFAALLLFYFFLSSLYSLGLKNKPVLELVIVASGFVLRALGGAIATLTPLSKWFVVVILFGSLVVVTSKRLAEKKSMGNVYSRKVVSQYTKEYLGFLLAVCSAITLTSYSYWAFSIQKNHVFAQLSILPLMTGFFLYMWHVDNGEGETPEDLIFHDFYMIGAGISTIIMLTLAFYI